MICVLCAGCSSTNAWIKHLRKRSSFSGCLIILWIMFGQDSPILVTGGAGFIGTNLILQWLSCERSPLVTLDKLTYAGNLKNLEQVAHDPRYTFVHGDIGDRQLVAELLSRHRPRAILHFAAESHVDRSIHGPDDFVRTNVNGTFSLLEETRAYWTEMPAHEQAAFRF